MERVWAGATGHRYCHLLARWEQGEGSQTLSSNLFSTIADGSEWFQSSYYFHDFVLPPCIFSGGGWHPVSSWLSTCYMQNTVPEVVSRGVLLWRSSASHVGNSWSLDSFTPYYLSTSYELSPHPAMGKGDPGS